jgi:putative heme-binding domain-containing protein
MLQLEVLQISAFLKPWTFQRWCAINRIVITAILLFALSPVVVLAQTSPAPVAKGSGSIPNSYRAATLAARGNADRGRRLFEDAARSRCAACHAIGGRGATLGPDLSGLGGGRASTAEILDAILEPSAKIHPDYASTAIALKSGRVLQGLLRPVNDAEVDVVTSATETVRIARSEIDEQSPSRVSLMPAGLHEVLSTGEMADLLAYLATLVPPRSASPSEAVNPRDIPHAIAPVSFQPIIDRDAPFQRPVWFGALPGHPGTMVVVEMQRARIWLLESNGSKRTLFADVQGETTPGELTGLTSLAFHPDFARNGRYFLKMHTSRGAGRLAVQIVERKAATDGMSDSGMPSKLLLKIPVFSEIHNGGHLAFGPDGYLYVGMGDTGPQGDPRGHGQDLSTLLGKISRIDVDRSEGDLPYAIPSDNPFRDTPGARQEVWALGFREPWRFSFDLPTRDLWVGDVGQGLYEEVSIARIGENHGWNVLEGFRPFSDRFAKADARYVPPVFAYHHRVGVSVTGGFVYRGKKNPSLAGKYIFGDFETRRVWALEQRDRKLTSLVEIGRAPDRIVSFGVDSEGEIHIVGHDRGLIYRIDATGADLNAAVPAREVVPTARQEAIAWKRTEERPSANWFREDFDDSSWTEAPAGFGTRGTPGATVRTEWRSRDIWLRRNFTLTETDAKTLALSVHHDEDAEIYINGVLAARLQGFVSDYDEIPISDEACAVLRPGKNLLAVHCHQTGGGQYIDVGIIQHPGVAPTAR